VRRILVIDDDDLVRTTVRQMLEAKGFDVVIASDGHHALRILDDTRFDAILVDIFMPGMDGLETIRAFRQRSPDIAIIAMSGTKFCEGTASAPDFLLMATKLGANGSLRKPFRSRDLVETIETCLGNSRSVDKPTLPNTTSRLASANADHGKESTRER
jgi:two-component system response regulator (stage 0 sporulation protein F)